MTDPHGVSLFRSNKYPSNNLTMTAIQKKILITTTARARQKAASLDKDTLLDHWSLTNENGPRMETGDLHAILTYNPANPDVKGAIDQYWPILNSSTNMEAIQN